ncbi:hypothetical protein MLD38_033705 [Melastoma candidum]|uniref:Uncharacterized protein n=1 Tax=Melastoma candidum TaxID=119954 RepID=A0ACB9MA85_9MYRT|nr:hypothetical protein MLD38_033705 [Melastoma candidum]
MQRRNGGEHWLTDFGACSGGWAGIKCAQGQVIVLQLPWKSLGGRLTEKIRQFQALRKLSLHNNVIGGPIPSVLGFLPNLRGVQLFNNRFAGSIPPSLGDCPLLQMLDVSNNSLTGSIPESLANCTKLYRLNVSFNSISGSVPFGVISSPSFIFLAVQHNNISGSIPEVQTRTRKKTQFQLRSLAADHSFISGKLLVSLDKFKGLQEVYLGSNNITGLIPDEVGNLPILQILDLSGGRNSHRAINEVEFASHPIFTESGFNRGPSLLQVLLLVLGEERGEGADLEQAEFLNGITLCLSLDTTTKTTVSKASFSVIWLLWLLLVLLVLVLLPLPPLLLPPPPPLLSVFNACAVINRFTRVAGETFGILIAVLFIQEAIKGMIAEFNVAEVDRSWAYANGTLGIIFSSAFYIPSRQPVLGKGAPPVYCPEPQPWVSHSFKIIQHASFPEKVPYKWTAAFTLFQIVFLIICFEITKTPVGGIFFPVNEYRTRNQGKSQGTRNSISGGKYRDPRVRRRLLLQ